MAKVGSKNTLPEQRVRKCAHALGYRFRLHRKSLPGSPDVVFPRLRKVIFVHGCFWHRHLGCPKAGLPKTRVEFWSEKFASNVTRDAANTQALERLGWQVLIVWECETRDALRLVTTVGDFLGQAEPISGEMPKMLRTARLKTEALPEQHCSAMTPIRGLAAPDRSAPGKGATNVVAGHTR